MTEIVRAYADLSHDVFLSHAREDKAGIAGQVYSFLERAGLKVWYDTAAMSDSITTDIRNGLQNSRAGVAIVTKHSTRKDWPSIEWDKFSDRGTRYRGDYKVVPILAPSMETPSNLKDFPPIRLEGEMFTAEAGLELIRLLHVNKRMTYRGKLASVYFARAAKFKHEVLAAEALADELDKIHLRIVRDASIDSGDCMNVRVARIMQSCHGAVVSLPARVGGKTSPYLLAEMVIATMTFKEPICLIVDEALTVPAIRDGLDELVDSGAGFEGMTYDPEGLRAAMNRQARLLRNALETKGLDGITPLNLRTGSLLADDDRVDERVHTLLGAFASGLPPVVPRPAQCFVGHLYERDGASAAYRRARLCVEYVAGMPCRSGDEFRSKTSDPAQVSAIIREIKASTFAIIDLTPDADGGPPVNTLMEAGIAMGAGLPIYYVMKGKQHVIEPPSIFMLGNPDIRAYEDEADLLAVVRRIASYYRRVIE